MNLPSAHLVGTADDSTHDEPTGMLLARKSNNTKFYLASRLPLSQLLKVNDENGNDITATCNLSESNGKMFIKYDVDPFPEDKYLKYNAIGPTSGG